MNVLCKIMLTYRNVYANDNGQVLVIQHSAIVTAHKSLAPTITILKSPNRRTAISSGGSPQSFYLAPAT